MFMLRRPRHKIPLTGVYVLKINNSTAMLQLLMLINLLGFAFIASQAFFYLLAMEKAQKGLKAPAYIELRNLLDTNLSVSLRIVYYTVLLTSILLCVLTFRHSANLLFITSVIACIALWVDVFIMTKGNLPLNRIFHTWTPDEYPADWQDFRAEWLRYYRLRQVAAIVAFTSLLIGAVFC